MRNLKKFLALVLALMMVVSVMVTVSATSFTDDAQITAKYDEAVEVLAGLDVLQGTETGKLNPKEPIIRSEMAAIAYRITTGDTTSKSPAVYTSDRFSDVPSKHWAYGFINWCADGGLLAGYPDGTFQPDETITGIDVVTILLRALGYGKADELTGAGYDTNAAKRAQELGIIDNIGLANLGKPATREMVAEMTFQTLRQFTVSYSVLYDYWKGVDTLGYKVFRLVEGTDVADTFGRPCHTWSSYGKRIAALPYEALVSYTTAVSECDMVSALGEKSNVAVADVYVNGYKYTNDAYNSAEHFLGANDTKGTLKATATAALVGAQGRLTEVYYYSNAYHVVMIDQFLAKVTDVKARTFDAAGHLKTPASIKLEAYDGASKTLYQEDSYADYGYIKDQYVLIYGVTNGGWGESLDASNDKFEIVAAAPLAATDKQTAYDVLHQNSDIGGKTYSWAAQYELAKPGANGVTYNVYTDTYGNLIGLTQPSTVKNYGIITDIAWVHSYLPLGDAHAAANLVLMDGTAVSNVTMGTVLNGGTTYSFSNTSPVNVSIGYVSDDKNNNTDYYALVYEYVENNGVYSITKWGTFANGTSIKQGVPNAWGSTNYTTDKTVYLVKTGTPGNYTYTSYTGFRTVPSMNNVNVCYLTDGAGTVTYAYVDATAASIPGSQTVAYIFADDSATAGMVGTNYRTHAVYVNGASVEYVIAGGKTLTNLGWGSAGVYTVETNAAGQITDVNLVTNDKVNFVTADNGTQVTFGANDSTVVASTDDGPRNCYGATFYEVNVANKTVTTTNAGTFKAHKGTGGVVFVLDAIGVVTTVYYVVG